MLQGPMPIPLRRQQQYELLKLNEPLTVAKIQPPSLPRNWRSKVNPARRTYAFVEPFVVLSADFANGFRKLLFRAGENLELEYKRTYEEVSVERVSTSHAMPCRVAHPFQRS